MPLKTVWCPDFQPDRDIAVWRAIPTLQIINGVGAQEFWKKYDATRDAQTGALRWPAGARQPASAAFDETQLVQLPFNQHGARPTRPTRLVDGLELACSETELLSRNPRRCLPLRQSIPTSASEPATRPERPGANL
jgi:hypothetical protein